MATQTVFSCSNKIAIHLEQVCSNLMYVTQVLPEQLGEVTGVTHTMLILK